MALERSLEGRDQLLKLVKRQAREIQELHRTGLQLGEPYTCHGSCLLSLYCDVRGVSYQKESGINSVVFERFLNQQFRCSLASHLSYDIHKRLDHSRGRIASPRQR